MNKTTTVKRKASPTTRKAKRSKELDAIIVKGAKEHNLKDIHISLPKKKLIVFTGVSGSGKSSLALDTIFAEGQRRYVESLSAYARQFIGQMEITARTVDFGASDAPLTSGTMTHMP